MDDVQAGDCSELVEHHDHPVNITVGKTLVTQLNIYQGDENPDYVHSSQGNVPKEEFSQCTDGSSQTHFSGRVLRCQPDFLKPSPARLRGTTVLEVLAIAKDIPVLLYYSWEGRVDVEVPKKRDLIRAEGKLYCEPCFAFGRFYSPVMADIVESRLLPRIRESHKTQDWGILKLRLRDDITKFDLEGEDLWEGYVFVRSSKYNPPPTIWVRKTSEQGWRRVKEEG